MAPLACLRGRLCRGDATGTQGSSRNGSQIQNGSNRTGGRTTVAHEVHTISIWTAGINFRGFGAYDGPMLDKMLDDLGPSLLIFRMLSGNCLWYVGYVVTRHGVPLKKNVRNQRSTCCKYYVFVFQKVISDKAVRNSR